MVAAGGGPSGQALLSCPKWVHIVEVRIQSHSSPNMPLIRALTKQLVGVQAWQNDLASIGQHIFTCKGAASEMAWPTSHFVFGLIRFWPPRFGVREHGAASSFCRCVHNQTATTYDAQPRRHHALGENRPMRFHVRQAFPALVP
eukprot:scaffold72044_cov27-Tisochrysis_lutea.AAC.4